jgi:putative endonuclease
LVTGDTTPAQWHLYLVRCPDGALYTGITTDVERRLAAHRDNRGAKRLRGRSPLQLVFSQAVGDRTQAMRVERRVKALSKSEKECIVRGERALPLPVGS